MNKKFKAVINVSAIAGLFVGTYLISGLIQEDPAQTHDEQHKMPASVKITRNLSAKEAGWSPKELCIEGVKYRFIPVGRMGSIMHLKENGAHQRCSSEVYPSAGNMFYKVCENGKLYYHFQNLRAGAIVEAVNLDGSQKDCQ